MKKIFICFAFMLLLFIPTQTMKAISPISLELKYGFDGEVQPYRGFPLHIKIKNTGEDFSGDLLIKTHLDDNITTSKKIDVDILANSEATYTIYMQGIAEHRFNSPLRDLVLYEGNYEKRKTIDFNGQNKIVPRFVSGNFLLAGGLTTDLSRIDTKLKLNGLMDIYELNSENFPESPIGLEMFSVIFIDNISVDTLNEMQMSSLLEWVKKGGMVISSGLMNQNADIFPLEIGSIVKSSNIHFMEQTTEQIVNTYDAQLKEGSSLVSHNNGVIHAMNKIGYGSVNQFNFILGDAPITSWDNYSSWLFSELDLAQVQISNHSQDSRVIINGGRTLNEVTSKFKAINLSFGALSMILLAYIFLVTVVVYIVLKKKRKLEYAWGVIPLVSVLSSLVIFIIGANSRFFTSNMNQIAVYTNDNGNLTGLLNTSVMSNRAGHLILNLNEQSPIYFINTNYYSNSSDDGRLKVVEEGVNNTKIDYFNVNYWGTVSATAVVEKENAGSLVTELGLTDGKISGTITNKYDFDFQKLGLWSGTDWYDIEGINAGETITIDIPVTNSLLSYPLFLDYYNNDENMEELKSNAMKNYYSYIVNSGYFVTNSPALVGQTTEMIHSFDLEKGNVKKEHLSFIYEPAIIQTEVNGKIVLNSSNMKKDLRVMEGQIDYSEKDNSWLVAQKGTYEIIFTLPDMMHNKTLTLEEVHSTYFDHLANTEFYLEDVISKEKFLLEDQNTISMNEEHQFIQNNQIKIILVVHENRDGFGMTIPELSLHLEVQ